MKDTYWFKHDSNARMDERTLELRATYGWEGYGVYWAVVETLREQDGYEFSLSKIGGLAVALGKDKEWTETFFRFCIELGLFVEDGQVFYSRSLKERMVEWDAMRESNRNAAKVRWDKERNADAMQVHTECIADAMPIREEKIREEEDIVNTPTAPKLDKARPKDIAEVSEYFIEIGAPVTEVEKFFDHYTANGWVQGKGKPIKDWKATARNWKRNMNNYSGNNGTQKQQYTKVWS